MTPWGLEPAPNGVCRVSPVFGSSHPRSPEPCAVYQTPPSRAGATSWGREPDGTENACKDVSEGVAAVGVTSAAGMGPMVDVSCDSGVGSKMTAGVGAEVGPGITAGVSAELRIVAVAETGSDSEVGLGGSLHPASPRIISDPSKRQAKGPEALPAPVYFPLLIPLPIPSHHPVYNLWQQKLVVSDRYRLRCRARKGDTISYPSILNRLERRKRCQRK